MLEWFLLGMGSGYLLGVGFLVRSFSIREGCNRLECSMYLVLASILCVMLWDCTIVEGMMFEGLECHGPLFDFTVGR